MKVQHALNLLCSASAEALDDALDSGDIEKISECVTPGALVKSETNTLSKALQVGRGRRHSGLPSPLPSPLPTPPSSPSFPTPTLDARTPALCAHTHKPHHDGENNTNQSLITTTNRASFLSRLRTFLMPSNHSMRA